MHMHIEAELSLLPASAGVMLGLLLNPEDGGNVGLSPNYITLQSRTT
jgi:hypothetical protein